MELGCRQFPRWLPSTFDQTGAQSPVCKGGVSYCTFWVGSDTKATTSLIEWPSHQRVASIYEVCGGGHPYAIRHSALLPPRLAQPWLLAHHMMGSILLSRLGA